MTPRPTVNDLTFQAATVNGSGSQSANLVLTRAIFAMGIPVAPKNVFPSNIEGLPTWYQLRISPQGYQSRKGDPDVLVALNPATWREDLASVRSGGAVIHEDVYATADVRDDVEYFPVPFAKLAKTRIESDTLRKQLTNLLYVGVVAGLLEIPFDAIETGIERTFPTKPRAWQAHIDPPRLSTDPGDEPFAAPRIGHPARPTTGLPDGQGPIQ